MSPALNTAAGVRACALRSALLAPDEWQALAALGDAGAVIERMKARGALGRDVADVLSAERSAHEAVIRNASGLLRFAGGPVAGLLGFFARYYDLQNIACVVRRIHSLQDEDDRPPARFYDTKTFGLLRPATLDAVTNFPSLVRALRHAPFAASLATAVQRYREDEDPVRLVERIEVDFFADWVRAAERCGVGPRQLVSTAMGVFLTAHAIEAAVRLMAHREAQSSRAVEWLSRVALSDRVDASLEILSRQTEADPVKDLVDVLLPGVSALDATPEAGLGPRGRWGLLDDIVWRAALKSTRGISFTAEFLTGILVRQFCQARELTVLLESKEADLDVSAVGPGEGRG